MATITNIKKIRADLYDNSEIVVRAKQYDKASRYLNITCTDEGHILRIDPDEYEVYAKVITPDNREIHNKETVNSDGTITVELTDSILNASGVGKIDINIYAKNSESLISTMNIKLIIIGSVYDDDNEINTNEYSALTDLIAEVTFKKNAYDKAEFKRKEAEDDRVTAENTRQNDEKIRQDQEKTRQDQESKRKNAESTRESNEEARKDAEKSRVDAEENRVSEFKTMMDNAESKISEAENVNINSESSTNSYTVTITNRNGVSTTSPNLLNKVDVGTVSTLGQNDHATASFTGDFGNQKLNLGIPVGKTPKLTIGTVSSGLTPSVTITGTDENPVLNLVLQKGLGDDDYLTVAEFEKLFAATETANNNEEDTMISDTEETTTE